MGMFGKIPGEVKGKGRERKGKEGKGFLWLHQRTSARGIGNLTRTGNQEKHSY